jgi:type I restriction enzyme S subunit
MYTVFEVDENRVYTPYLLRVLKSPWALSHYATMGSGSVHRRRSISFETLSRLSVPLPDLVEQRSIAAILDKAVSLRRKRQEAITLASELVRSKFFEMFGEPHTNFRGLPRTSLGDLVRLKSGNFLPSHEMAGTGGVFVYGGNGVNGEHDKAMFDEVKLVIGRVGAYCGAVHLTKPHSWITDNALYVSEISPLVRLEYLAFALTQAKLNQYSSQSGQPLVSASRLYPVMLLLPPLSLQDVFLKVLDRTTRIQASQTNSLEALEEMFRSLASRLFT